MLKYKDNVSTVILNVKRKLKNASDLSKLNRTIGTYLVASNLRRIHNEGLAVNGSIIGVYSNKPIYISPKNSPRQFLPKGKNGQTKFRNGKPHRTGYFIGYRGFRVAIGRESGVVNLQLSGRLFKDWAMEQRGNDTIIGFRSNYGTKISQGNEQHFGKKIYGITENDIKEVKIIEEKFINEAIA